MKINPINNTNFGKISVSNNAKQMLEKRLNPTELNRFNKLIQEQTSNKNNICLDTFHTQIGRFSNTKVERLCATVGSNPNIYCEDFMTKISKSISSL